MFIHISFQFFLSCTVYYKITGTALPLSTFSSLAFEMLAMGFKFLLFLPFFQSIFYDSRLKLFLVSQAHCHSHHTQEVKLG